MTTAAKSTVGAVSYNNHDANITMWELAAGQVGEPLVDPAAADRSIHFYGTFGGATVVLEGSNEPDETTASNYETLTDPQGNAISKASSALRAVTEMVRQVRPRVVGGDGTTQIFAKLLAKR